MKFEIINVVSLILIHEKLGKFQMIIALMQYLLLQILLFEFLSLLLIILTGSLVVEHALAHLVAPLVL